MQNPLGFGRIKSVQGITGSTRPCITPSCRGELHAMLHKYEDGKFRLAWRCTLCHLECEFGVADAITREPQTATEALD